MKITLFTLAFAIASAAIAHADYTMDLLMQINSSNQFVGTPSSQRFHAGFFFRAPNAAVLEDGVPTDDFVTLTSPDQRYRAFLNHPNGTLNEQTQKLTAEAALASASGVWELSIDDGVDVHRYEIEVALSDNVSTVPRLASHRLVEGNVLGDFDWTLEDLNPTTPLSDWSYFGQIVQSEPFDLLALQAFSPGETGWTIPDFDVEADSVFASLTAQSDSVYQGLVAINGVTATSANAPGVTINNVSLGYTASIAARLQAVPEPAGASIAVIALAALATIRKRSV